MAGCVEGSRLGGKSKMQKVPKVEMWGVGREQIQDEARTPLVNLAKVKKTAVG